MNEELEVPSAVSFAGLPTTKDQRRFPSVSPLNKESAQALQNVSACTDAFERPICRIEQNRSFPARLVQPEQRRICRLLRSHILAGGLAKLLRALRHVENVVHNLEGQ